MKSIYIIKAEIGYTKYGYKRYREVGRADSVREAIKRGDIIRKRTGKCYAFSIEPACVPDDNDLRFKREEEMKRFKEKRARKHTVSFPLYYCFYNAFSHDYKELNTMEELTKAAKYIKQSKEGWITHKFEEASRWAND